MAFDLFFFFLKNEAKVFKTLKSNEKALIPSHIFTREDNPDADDPKGELWNLFVPLIVIQMQLEVKKKWNMNKIFSQINSQPHKDVLNF